MTQDERYQLDQIKLFFAACVECAAIRHGRDYGQLTAAEKHKYEMLRVAGEEALRWLLCPFTPDPPKVVAKKPQIT